MQSEGQVGCSGLVNFPRDHRPGHFLELRLSHTFPSDSLLPPPPINHASLDAIPSESNGDLTPKRSDTAHVLRCYSQENDFFNLAAERRRKPDDLSSAARSETGPQATCL